MIERIIPFELLLADIGQVITVVVVAFFIIITVIGNIVAKINEQQAKARRVGGGQPPRPRPPQQQGGGGGGLGDEIAQFLRRAAQGQAAPPEPQPVRQLVEAEAVPEPIRKVGGGIDTSTFDSRANRLGSDVANEEEQFGRHLQETFDHDVGSLSAPGEAAKPSKRRAQVPPTAAAGFAAMLSNADNIRQAIVITEIINRPRWD